LRNFVERRHDAPVALVVAGETYQDHLADHAVEQAVGLCRLLQHGEAIRLCGSTRPERED
jgi:hypothetical protein